MYTACLVNIHPLYVFWTNVPGYDMGHSLCFGPDSFAEPGVNAHVWSPHILHGKFPGLLECLRGTLLETHALGVLVDADGVLPGHHSLMAERPFFFRLPFFSPPFFVGTIVPGKSEKVDVSLI